MMQVKNHLWVFVNCLIENPTFDSQTKETMTLQSKSFGSKCEMSEKFYNQSLKVGIVEAVLSWAKHKEMVSLCSSRSTDMCAGANGQKVFVEKNVEAEGHSQVRGCQRCRNEEQSPVHVDFDRGCVLVRARICTACLGDSAKALAVSGLGVVGRDHYGVFPLKGKVLNVREATHKQILENPEINNVIKILGLQYKKKYDTDEDMKTLRYGKVMVMADQDQDGSHIKGLFVNFIHHNWPSLIRRGFVEEFITPIVKATKNKQEVSFFSLPEYVQWKQNTPNWQSWRVKYYKGVWLCNIRAHAHTQVWVRRLPRRQKSIFRQWRVIASSSAIRAPMTMLLLSWRFRKRKLRSEKTG
jgi:DNA topoisomerase-2